ncbi:hypothetical protein MICAB_590006 [Microcystis aeruginosa PCC 9717]|jgi:hypothetical protein|uniref:Uncharacterized protein n=2 Tax=Microcystis aeruginosa TaxID=1126 RepID=I4G6J1_MICAE|nr:hypothetical protein MICAB_590006 [Microcystis aeruginosa PCC 9717]CCI03552.1 hypothetical protein MICAC_4670024 [Microcystis aeruginosa PCC 9443]
MYISSELDYTFSLFLALLIVEVVFVAFSSQFAKVSLSS